ncbi:MAG: dihydrofolate reductase family protein [Solirubrobacterales bacterium]|nr:dihydrofolate reductase family protein [Solirubrobacterales bacterium]
MPRLTVDLFTTLDGFASGEQSPAYFGQSGPELGNWIERELARPQVVLMGRVTFESLAASSRSAETELTRRLTALPKVVFSETLDEPLGWANSRLVKSGLAAEVRSLKETPGDPLRTVGSPVLVSSLLTLGLVDRLRLVVFPQVLSSTGRDLIFANLPDIQLDLVGTHVLDSRLVLLEYDVR